MAIPAYIELYDDQNCKVEGDCRIQGREGWVEALAFNHGLSIPTDSHSGQLTGMRKHDPISFLKQFDKSSPYLYKACSRGQTFKKVVIHWFKINDNGVEQEYFRHELADVKVTSVNPYMANVKDPTAERYPHLENVALRYAKITWRHNDGGLEYTDSWNEGKG